MNQQRSMWVENFPHTSLEANNTCPEENQVNQQNQMKTIAQLTDCLDALTTTPWTATPMLNIEREDPSFVQSYHVTMWACTYGIDHWMPTKLKHVDRFTTKLVDHLTTKLVKHLTTKLEDRSTAKLVSCLTTKQVNAKPQSFRLMKTLLPSCCRTLKPWSSRQNAQT